MAYSPATSFRGDQYLYQGLASAGQSLAQGMMLRDERQKEEKQFAAKTKAVEGLIKTHPDLFGGEQVVNDLLRADPEENPLQRYARLGEVVTGTAATMQMQRQKQEMETQQREQSALGNMGAMAWDPQTVLAERYLGGGGSNPSTLYQMTQVDEMMRQRYAAPFTPKVEALNNPVTGQPVAVLQTSPNSAQVLKEDKPGQAGTGESRLWDEAMAAKAAGDMEKHAFLMDVVERKRAGQQYSATDLLVLKMMGIDPNGAGGGSAPALSPQDQQALDWALANPADPRAAQIRQRLNR